MASKTDLKRILMPSEDWDDPDRVDVLFAPFRSKTLNPEAWSAKMSVWNQLIKAWVKSVETSRLSFSLKEIQDVFAEEGRKPHCLSDVIDDMKSEKQPVIVSLEDFQRSLSCGSTTWSVSVASAAKNLLGSWWSTNSQVPDKAEARIVAPCNARRVSVALLDKLRCREAVARIGHKFLVFSQAQLQEASKEANISDVDTGLTLRFLQMENKIAEVTFNKEKLFKVAVSSKESVFPKESDITIVKLHLSLEQVKAHAQRKSNEAASLREQAKRAIETGNRVEAKMRLRSKRRVDAVSAKYLDIADNLEEILTQLDMAATDAEVITCYKSGLDELRRRLDKTDISEVEDLLLDVREAVENNRSVTNALSAGIGDEAEIDDDLLEAEFEKLLSDSDQAAQPQKDLQDVVNKLKQLDVSDPTNGMSSKKSSKKLPVLS